MRGNGDGEGWSYIAESKGFDESKSAEIRGLLYRGDLPPSVARAAS